MKISSITDQNGRESNQDVFSILPKVIGNRKVLCCIVSDGMGGTDAGDVASNITKEAFDDWFETECPKYYQGEYSVADIKDSIIDRVLKANREILKWKDTHDETLGSTLVLLLLCEGEYIVSNIGDSRAYKFGSRSLQITKDQTLAQLEIDRGNLTEEEAKKDKRQHKLTQCLGMDQDPSPDFFKGKYNKGDFFLLCSDGMYNTMDLEEIKQIVTNKKNNTKTKLNQLMKQAKNNGEKDNITGVLIEI